MTIVIQVPEYNDSFSRVVLGRKEYLIRFSYNDSGNYWTFGIYDGNRNPYVTGIKIVPNAPLNFFYLCHGLPDGIFAAVSSKERIERYDFRDKKAQFAFTPIEDLLKLGEEETDGQLDSGISVFCRTGGERRIWNQRAAY